jgi:hypothetical protein
MTSAGKWLPPLLLVLALVGSVTGCSSPQADGAQRLGASVEIRSPHTSTLATLTLERVKVDIPCTQAGAPPPLRGHYIALYVTVQTTPEYRAGSGWWIDPAEFTTADADGDQTGTGVTTTCLPLNQHLPEDFNEADAGYYGVVLIDSAGTDGTIKYNPANLLQGADGWSWAY